MRIRASIRGVIFLLGIFAIVAALPITGYSEVPHQINFQGYLTDELGNPQNGNYVMVFAIYEASSGGTSPWWEEQAVTVTNGIYNVLIGQDPTGNPFPETLFDGLRWLGVNVEGDGEMTPRQPLTSTAFALKAGDADTIAGQTLGDLNTAYVNIGETDVVTSAMVAPNTLLASDLAANSVNASEISTGAVGTLEIANGAMTAEDLAEDYVNTTGDTMTGTLELTENLKLPPTTSTTGIIMSGSSTLIHTYGNWNFFAGDGAGNLDMTGDLNTASGYRALNSNTEGDNNTASGYRALDSNTTGDNNTASGSEALYSNTEGDSNTASGYRALDSNTTGSSNTASGVYALHSNTTGLRNTAIGVSALLSNTRGNANTSSGIYALYSNTTGSFNTASGYSALNSNTEGDNNTASGASALRSNTEGERNTASGYGALYSNITGYQNTASGFSALHANTTGYDNTASGAWALDHNITGIHGTALGKSAGNTNTTGNGNTFIGCDSDASADNLINATALGYDALVNGSNRVRIGNTYVSQIGGNVGWSNLSDIRRKEDIEDITLGLDFINTLRPVQFSLIDGNGGVDLGFIAQDIETLLGTEYNILGIGGNSDRTLSLRYTDFIAPMVKAIQEQHRQIEEQEAYIKTLEKRLSRLEALLIVSRQLAD